MEFAETEDFEIVQALKIKKNYSQDRCIYCFALDPDNLEHWRYFFENGFVKLQNENLSIFNSAAEVQQTSTQPSGKTDSLDSSIKDEADSSHSFLPTLSHEQCLKRYGTGVCWGFQRQTCENERCIKWHKCSCCYSLDHGSEACPIIRFGKLGPTKKREKINNKNNFKVDESLTPLELAEMLGAIADAKRKGRNAVDKSKRRRKKGNPPKKGHCFDFQKGMCVKGKNCAFKHSCISCDSYDHGRMMCRNVWFQTGRPSKRKRKRKRKRNRLRNKDSFQTVEVKRKARKKSSIGTNPLTKSAIRSSSVCVKREGMQKFP